MGKDKRYTVTLDAYIHARNDREAMVKAAQLAQDLRNVKDNEAQVLKLDETPFASCHSRRIHTGRLTIFENKIIESPSEKQLCELCPNEAISYDVFFQLHLCKNCKTQLP